MDRLAETLLAILSVELFQKGVAALSLYQPFGKQRFLNGKDVQKIDVAARRVNEVIAANAVRRPGAVQ